MHAPILKVSKKHYEICLQKLEETEQICEFIRYRRDKSISLTLENSEALDDDSLVILDLTGSSPVVPAAYLLRDHQV